MIRRYQIYVLLAGLLLVGLVFRWGCSRQRDQIPAGDSLEALLAEIEILGRRQDSENVPRFVELAAHENKRIMRAAIYALGDNDSPQAAAALRTLLNEADNPEVRAAAAEALGQGSTTDPGQLIKILNSEDDPLARLGAARGLARWSSPKRTAALPALVKALEDTDPRVRAWAIRGVHRVSIQRFLYQADKPPALQQDRIQYIQHRLRERGLLPN